MVHTFVPHPDTCASVVLLRLTREAAVPSTPPSASLPLLDNMLPAADAEPDARLRSLLSKWGTSILCDENDTNTKILHMDPNEAPHQQEVLRNLRRQLDDAGRCAKAEEYKALANAQFSKGASRVAFVGYLAGIWMLRTDGDDPPCPRLLANHLSDLQEAVAALGPPRQQVKAASAALRAALHVNLAAAALKLDEWRAARAACEAVLATEPRHQKALWRLAKAHEGDGNLTGAMGAASKLLECDADNKDAARLLEALRQRKVGGPSARSRRGAVTGKAGRLRGWPGASERAQGAGRDGRWHRVRRARV